MWISEIKSHRWGPGQLMYSYFYGSIRPAITGFRIRQQESHNIRLIPCNPSSCQLILIPLSIRKWVALPFCRVIAMFWSALPLGSPLLPANELSGARLLIYSWEEETTHQECYVIVQEVTITVFTYFLLPKWTTIDPCSQPNRSNV